MNPIITATVILLGLLAATQLVIWAAQAYFTQLDNKRSREQRSAAMLTEAACVAYRTQRNHRQFDRALWDRR